jgi:uncharacterized membrane protein
MEGQIITLGTIFIVITFLGFYLAYLYGRKTKEFRWREYFAIIVWPVSFILVLSYVINIRILSLFVVSCFVGFVLEYIIGLAYHKTLNRRLWTYSRLDLDGYTSLLTIPMWGSAGVIFWYVSKLVGL